MATLENKEPTVLENKDKEDIAWQTKLLPFMIGMPTVVALFFFIVSLIQINNLNNKIQESNEINLKPALSLLEENNKNALPANTKLDYTRWKTLSTLETSSLQLRYRQANIILMFSVWTRYLGFVTGMILALVGSSFILGKLREPTSKLDADSGSLKFSITTASPGLIMSLLGTILMITTLMKNFEVNVTDAPVYTQLWFEPSVSEMPPPADLPPQIQPSDEDILGDVQRKVDMENKK